MTFGERIKYIREQRNMTQEELAHAIGLQTKAAVSKIEKGIVDPNQSTIQKLAVALGISPSDLFFDDAKLSDNEKDIIHWYRTNPNFKAGVDSLVVALNIEKKSEGNGTSSKRA